MKLLIYAHSFAPNVGGAETYAMLLAQGLAEERDKGNLEVTITTQTPAGAMDDGRLPFRVVRRPGAFTLLRLIWGADILHLAGPCMFPLGVGLLLRKPVVMEHHGYQAICPNGLLLYEPTRTACPGHFMAREYSKCLRCNAKNSGWIKSFLQLALTFPRRWASKLVTTNAPISQHVENRLRLPHSKVIYYGVPDPLSGSERPVSGVSGNGHGRPGPPTFAYVGRLVAEKGIPTLLDAARQLTDAGYSFRLKIVGDGPERGELEKKAASLGLGSSVHFSGWLAGAALQAELEGVTAVVMATLMEETAGLALIEHMMRGGLVIASDIGGMGEVVDGTGLKFTPGSATGLAACLRRVLDDPGLVNTLGSKARVRARELFTQDRMVNQHLGLYREVIS